MPFQPFLRSAWVLIAAAAALTACGDQPLAPPAEATPSAPSGTVVAALTCTVDARAESLSCTPVSPGARMNLLTFGGQNHYVRLTSSATAFDGATGELSSKVLIQNLLTVPLATSNGTTPDAGGLRVFFSTPPTNGVTVVNATGTDVFTAAGQPYFEYDDDLTDEVATKELGGNGILSPGEETANKLWRFQLNGASSFTFTLFLQTQVPTGTSPFVRLASVSTGGMHACGLDAAGKAYCWGHGQYGEVGDGTYNSRLVPTVPSGGLAFASISVGTGHTCALTAGGTAYCWGWNLFGGVGDNTTSNRGVPTAVAAAPQLSSIAAGYFSSCGLSSAGQVYCWGWNAFGQLGDGTLVQRKTPVAAAQPAGLTFASVVMGSQHACALTAAGQAYCWGDNSYGQVGDGTKVQRTVPTPVYQPGGLAFTALDAGTYRTCGLTAAGRAYCWGNPNDGHFSSDTVVAAPQPANLVFTRVEVGHAQACGLTAAGKVFCWGANPYGALGNGGTAASAVPAAVVVPAGLAFTSFSFGTSSACAATAKAGTYCWGANEYGELGDGTSTDRLLPVVVAGTF
jgi:alpha-tubulin suppressor-like RCC1 family protein